MATAQEKFKVGQQVRMTKAALKQRLDGEHVKRNTGIVTGFPVRVDYGDPALLVRVRRDGDKQTKQYHMDFWEPIGE